VSEQFLNGTSAQYRLCSSAILLKLQKLSIYNRFKNNSNRDEITLDQISINGIRKKFYLTGFGTIDRPSTVIS